MPIQIAPTRSGNHGNPQRRRVITRPVASDSDSSRGNENDSNSDSESGNDQPFPGYHVPPQIGTSQDPSRESIYIQVLEQRLAESEKKHLESTQRLAALEAQFQKLDQKSSQRNTLSAEQPKDSKQESESATIPILPQVRRIGYQDFKNQFRDDEYQYAIEVLMAGFDIRRDVQEAQRLAADQVPNMPFFMTSHGLSAHDNKPSLRSETTLSANKLSPYRIRIRSLPLLIMLNNLICYNRKMEVTTFARPFKPLIYHQSTMKQYLAELETKWGEAERSQVDETSKPPLESDPANGKAREIRKFRNRSDSEGTHTAEIVDSVEALRAMRVYVDFVDKELMPLYHQFDNSNSEIPPHRIRFDDIWYLFRLGELVFNPDAPDPSSSLKRDVSSRSRRVMRVYSIGYPNHGTEGYSNDDKVLVRCYFIDFNGEAYVPVKQKFLIPYFEGEKEIRSLDIYPIRFAFNHAQILQDLYDQGKLFQSYIAEQFVSCKGWTLGDHEYPEYIDSDVIVDFVEALKAHPRWTTSAHAPALHDEESHHMVTDSIPIVTWTDRDRSAVAWKSDDEIYTATSIDILERNASLKNDRFLEERRDKRKILDQRSSSGPVGEQDYVLLPRRLFVYSLQDRKFVSVDIRNLRYIVNQGEAFKSVIISKEHKHTINALVDVHFERKDFENDPTMVSLNQDTLRNKGRGLVILLHGVPGVGKTSTAEAVAQAKKKPLFPITCGDLGFSPSDVETSLKEIFRLAHLWDCVLLLDEADVFLSQRSTWDLKRNALVSVFLRILEYYNGILFLTTNRVGTLDEAFRSRIHVKLYYPPLSEKQTKEIWKMNLKQLNKIENERLKNIQSRGSSDTLKELPLKVEEESILEFAVSYWRQHQHGKGRWNGRQIRNAFQIAAALARFEARSAAQKLKKLNASASEIECLQGELKARHFKTVAETSHHFEMYMHETVGKTEAELALEQGNRADHVSRLRQSPMHEHLTVDYEIDTGVGNIPQHPHGFPGISIGQDWDTRAYTSAPQGMYPSQIPVAPESHSPRYGMGPTVPRRSMAMQSIEEPAGLQMPMGVDFGYGPRPTLRPGESSSPNPAYSSSKGRGKGDARAWSGAESGSDYE
ncbi:hypothetical protein N7462_001906 [Penicillium macrosclerotiorum]|uniref:uncharacterized protein n=1 Tax=Penicillium macrosclerotiorum TaxID=303699 RepID=UPI0025492E6C|nr:uncharacterized protein N7462_001906 [Penicillium macrosclerotiorum]KAJ5692483.1 hypothetical protein N7462_001906 [Penicillium macrosclerotiorum]